MRSWKNMNKLETSPGSDYLSAILQMNLVHFYYIFMKNYVSDYVFFRWQSTYYLCKKLDMYSIVFKSIFSIVRVMMRNILGWTKMHEVFTSLLPRYFLKDIHVKWSQFEFQTIFSKFHYSPRRLKFLFSNIVLAKFRLKIIFEFFLIKVSQKL